MKVVSIYKYTPAAAEKNGQPSQTVPGRSMTIKEILQRFTSGLLAPEDLNHSQFDYLDENDLDDDPRFDDPEDDLLYDGATDIAEVHQAMENSKARARAAKASDAVQQPKNEPKEPKEEPQGDDAGE